MWRLLGLIFVSAGLSGCEDKFKAGYDAGYAAGHAQASNEAERRMAYMREEAERERAVTRSVSPYTTATTTVCGGGGLNFNGKHFDPGKTGCVQVMSDGTVRRY